MLNYYKNSNIFYANGTQVKMKLRSKDSYCFFFSTQNYSESVSAPSSMLNDNLLKKNTLQSAFILNNSDYEFSITMKSLSMFQMKI